MTSRFEWINDDELNTLLNAVMFSMGSRTSFKPGELDKLAALAIEIEDELVDRGRNG